MHRFYFDHNATTPISREVLELDMRLLVEVFGNASSIHHHGQVARRTLDEARSKVASLLGCERGEIAFTSGGTESDNLAIFGIARAADRQRSDTHVITSSIEHPAVLRTCEQLEREGIDVSYLRVGSSGVIDPDDVKSAIRPGTALISVMHANNEIGTVQPVADIAGIARAAGVPMHSDGVQAAGKIFADTSTLGVDLYSISAHKMQGPKGTGALFIRKGTMLDPILHGGRHENGRRAGTENVSGAASLGEAARLASDRLKAEGARISGLRDRLEEKILERVPQVSVNGSGPRLPNTTNLCFEGIEGEALVIALDLRGFCVSSGSACSSGAVEPSHVLMAIGLPKERAKSSLRFSLGWDNTVEQVDALADAVAASAAHLRRISPVYVTHA